MSTIPPIIRATIPPVVDPMGGGLAWESGGGLPLLPPLAPTIASSGTTIHIGDTITITAGGGGPPASYTAYVDGVSIGTVVSGHTVASTEVGDWYVTATNGAGTSAASNTVLFTIPGTVVFGALSADIVQSGGLVSQWTDSVSGSSRNATQSTDANKPRIGRTIGGRGAIGPNLSAASAGLSSLALPSTLSTYAKRTGSAIGAAFTLDKQPPDATPATAYNGWPIITSATGYWGLYVFRDTSDGNKIKVGYLVFGSAGYCAAAQISYFTCYSAFGWHDGSNVNLRLGTAAAVTAVQSTAAPAVAGDGEAVTIMGRSGSLINGTVAFLGVWSAVPTSGQRDDICGMLAQRYTSGVAQKVVMEVGDSIEADSVASSAQHRAQRQALYLARSPADNRPDLAILGPRIDKANVFFASDYDNCAGGNTLTGQLTDNADATLGAIARFDGALIYIYLGTNDFGVSGHSAATVASDYGQLIDQDATNSFHVKCPTSPIYICDLFPRQTGSYPPGDTAAVAVAAWNSAGVGTPGAAKVVADAAGRGVTCVRRQPWADPTVLAALAYVDSGLHPAASMGAVMAAVTMAMIRADAGLPP